MKFIKKYLNTTNSGTLNLVLILLIFLVFFEKFNIFKNTYYLLKLNHHERLIKAYNNYLFSGFCKKDSNGYLFYIKKKYPEKFNDNEMPQIINNFNGGAHYWTFLNINAEITDNKKIILNNEDNIDFDNYKIIDEFENKCFFIEKND